MKFRGKVTVVTGGGNGMGRELVLGLLSRGAKVFAVDINEQSLRQIAELAGDIPAAKAARVILDGIERDARRIFVGRDARVMDWFARISPFLTARLVYSQMRSVLPVSTPTSTL